jgi:maltose/moltooligosaccharide transporter
LFSSQGAVAASLAPWLLNNVFGLSNTAPAGEVPASVTLAFYIGAAALFAAVMWTVLTTREYPPEALDRFHGEAPAPAQAAARVPAGGGLWLAAGLAVLGTVQVLALDKELLLLGGLLAGYGAAKLIAAARLRTRSARSCSTSTACRRR